MMTTVCSHYFHKECIIGVYKIDNKCPLCRIDLRLKVKDILEKIKFHSKNKEYIKILIDSLEQLAGRNNLDALFNLSIIYSQGKYIEKNNELSIKYLIKSADLGFSEAQYYLGFLYDNGIRVNQDYELAFKYYKLAADQNNHKAQYNIGKLL